MGKRPAALGATALAMVLAIGAAGACIRHDPAFDPITEAGPPPTTSFGDAGGLADVDLGPAFAITGLQPSHGPWTGGTRTTIAGRGFPSNLQVWIGGTQLPAANVFASDPTRAAVLTPPGTPGPADVRVVNVATAEEATLPAGFIYDAFSVTPGTGSTTGGTRIALLGSGTHWTAASTVSVGGLPCTATTFTDATHLSCVTPPNGPGSQNVLVANADGTADEADDAFVYSDSPDGYRGGLYGGALSGTLNVLGFDAWTGQPLAGGQAIAGSNLATATVGTLGANGTVQLTGSSLTGKVTVTLAAKCHQPMTYVDVPVDTVTFYLPPELDYSCIGDPQSTGNYVPPDYGSISGELVWPSPNQDYQNAGWSNVPAPGPGERQAAYVFLASSNPTAQFSMPSPSSATTPSMLGQVGYTYALPAPPGNVTLYAIAGIEADTDAGTIARFDAYAMGVVRGVSVQPNATTTQVDIPMSTSLDRALKTVPQPPPASPSGPDRLLSTLTIALGATSYAALPQGTVTTLLPVPGDVSFVGVPALDGTLAGNAYALSASAVTGPLATPPLSVVSGITTTDANDPLTIGGFLGIPSLTEPGATTWPGTHVTLQASGPVNLAVIDVQSGGGLLTWQIVAPGSDLSFDLPDLSQVQGVASLVRGVLRTNYAVARINGFQYATLVNGQLYASAWSAYAENVATGAY